MVEMRMRAAPHKWLLAPAPAMASSLCAGPAKGHLGHAAQRALDDYEPASGLFRLMQFGTANGALLAGLDAALDFYLRVGPEKIERPHHRGAVCGEGLQKIKGVEIASPVHPALPGYVTYGFAQA